MDVRCPACAAQYVVDDEKLRGKTARMRCKACQTAWMVTGPSRSNIPVATASPPMAAVVRTGKERERRDLFAPVESAPVSAPSSVLPPPTFGARNESSVLFSLDQLKKSSIPPAPKEASVNSGNGTAAFVPEDDGVIDLHALSSAPPRPPVAPLFSEPTPMSVDIQTGKVAASKSISKAQLFGGIAAAAAVFLLATGGIALALRGEEPVKPTAAPPPPPVVAALPPKVEPPPPAAPAAAAENEPTDAKAAKKTAKGRSWSKGGTASSTKSFAATAPAPRPVKAADPCHCGGKFDCILACTAKSGK